VLFGCGENMGGGEKRKILSFKVVIFLFLELLDV
jgi:hypothetical protein